MPITIDSTREDVLKAVRENPHELGKAPAVLRNDRDIVWIAVEIDGTALKHASDELQNNIEIVLAAVKQNGSAFVYADRSLQGDKMICSAAVQQNPLDKVIALTVVSINGLALESVDPTLQNNREVVFAALTQSPRALHYVAPRLKREIVYYQKLHQCTPAKALTYSQLHILGATEGVLTSAKKELPSDIPLPQLPKVAIHLVGFFLHSQQDRRSLELVCTAAHNLALTTTSSPIKRL